MWTLAAQSAGGTWIPLLVVYALIFGGFWFISSERQKKEQKRVQAMIADMKCRRYRSYNKRFLRSHH